EAVNPALNGLAYEAFDRALARAEAGPVPGFFGGIPTYVKDNAAVAGMPTMEGTDAWDPRPQPAHGDFARLYLGTGVIPLGKTQMSEFGFSASAEHPRLGPVRNPWHPEHTAGASSSGSGAFVAAGVVPIAHANDGGGSIRIPAACNGLVGLKPSRAGCRWTATCGRCRCESWPTGCSPGRCATPPRSTGKPNCSPDAPGCRRSATSPARAPSGCASRCAPGRSTATPAPRCGN